MWVRKAKEIFYEIKIPIIGGVIGAFIGIGLASLLGIL